jgi:hypothetical protein
VGQAGGVYLECREALLDGQGFDPGWEKRYH